MTNLELISWRQRHDMTQVEAAKKLGLPLSTYKKREYGTSAIPDIMVIAMRVVDLDISK